MGKQLNLVYVQQNGAFIQFFNKIDGSAIAIIELSQRAIIAIAEPSIF